MRIIRTGIVVLVPVLLLTGCGFHPEKRRPPDTHAPAVFTERKVTWALGTTLHYGTGTYTIPGQAAQLWRTSYGFVVGVRRTTSPSTIHYFFISSLGISPFRGRPQDVKVSPDGHYVGWIDLHGQRAQAVVLDLTTGREVLRDDRQVGGTEAHFLGFDDKRAYWTSGDESLTARIGDWLVGQGTGKPYDRLAGRRTTMAAKGTESTSGSGTKGLVSPEGRWCLTTGVTGRLPVVGCADGRRVTPRYPSRFVAFGGWQDADTFAVLARRRAAADTGVITSCSLRTRDCTPITPVRHAASVVFAIGTR